MAVSVGERSERVGMFGVKTGLVLEVEAGSEVGTEFRGLLGAEGWRLEELVASIRGTAYKAMARQQAVR